MSVVFGPRVSNIQDECQANENLQDPITFEPLKNPVFKFNQYCFNTYSYLKSVIYASNRRFNEDEVRFIIKRLNRDALNAPDRDSFESRMVATFFVLNPKDPMTRQPIEIRDWIQIVIFAVEEEKTIWKNVLKTLAVGVGIALAAVALKQTLNDSKKSLIDPETGADLNDLELVVSAAEIFSKRSQQMINQQNSNETEMESMNREAFTPREYLNAKWKTFDNWDDKKEWKRALKDAVAQSKKQDKYKDTLNKLFNHES